MNLQCILFLALLLSPLVASSEVYDCVVIKRIEVVTEYRYSAEELQRLGLSIRIEVTDKDAVIYRCRNRDAGEEPTCQAHTVDHLSYDENRGSTKFYLFDEQIEVQLFRDLVVLENDGRGTSSVAACGPFG